MTTSISSEAFEKNKKFLKIKDITLNKNQQTKWVIEQMFSDNKNQRDEEKHFIKNQRDGQNIYRICICLYMRGMFTEKNQSLISIGGEKIAFLIFLHLCLF